LWKTTKIISGNTNRVGGVYPASHSASQEIVMPNLLEMEDAIKQVTDEIRDMLLAKNKAYGNSTADPLRIFSKVNSVEQINVRMDDKLSRIARGSAAGEDAEWDLIGYLILKRAVLKFQDTNKEK